MVLTHLIDRFRRFLAPGIHLPNRRANRLDELLTSLERKQSRLQRQLARETNHAKRRHLQLELKVARLQHRKGVERRLQLG